MRIDGSNSNADVYVDLAGLDKLRKQARETPDEAIEQVAKQFEGMFLNMVLKSMREASLAEGLFDNSAMETHQSMYDQQLALEISSGDGLGFAKALQAQLGAVAGIAPRPLPELPVSAGALVNRAPLPGLIDGLGGRSGVSETTSKSFESPAEFVQTLLPVARRAAEKLGVKPEVLLAQAAHETGWGRHIPQHADGQSSHNLFGIKAGGSWQGEQAVKQTFEVIGGVPRVERAAFRAYDSFESCLDDYAELIGGLARYGDAVANADSPEGYLRGLQSGGYATDPAYADKVMSVLQSPRFQDALNATRAQATPFDAES